ncbi:MAG: DUF1854 domain-containing protein [Propionivibrio sp.]
MTTTVDFQLRRDAFGRLVLTDNQGEAHCNVVPVRAFPISSPGDGIALVNPYGHELAWIDHPQDLHDDTRKLVEEELASREFMPVIKRIVNVSSFATPSTWTIATNHGDTQLVLKGEEDIRRLGLHGLLIADSHGIHFHIPDRQALDLHSRKILDRFL